MKLVRKGCHVVVAAWVAMVGACGGGGVEAPNQTAQVMGNWTPSRTSLPSTGNYVYLVSDAGDTVGEGLKATYLHADSTLSVVANGNRLSVSVDGAQQWAGEFQLKSTATRIERGYSGTVRQYPLHDPAVGGLNWSGEGRACSTLEGWFSVDSVSYVNSELSSVELRFEQRCNAGSPALHGKIRWSAVDITTASNPVLPVPVGLWAPTTGSTPATGNYVYVTSDPTEFIGEGRTYTFQPSNAAVVVTESNGLLKVEIETTAGTVWHGWFESTDTANPLSVGYYARATRQGFQAEGVPGVDWSGDGRGCGKLNGWFAVDSITYAGGALASVDLRFVQRCDGSTLGLGGKIHWVL